VSAIFTNNQADPYHRIWYKDDQTPLVSKNHFGLLLARERFSKFMIG